MRLVTVASLVTLAAAAPMPAATACGVPPPPHVLAVSDHWTRAGRRTFVVLDEAAPDHARWQRLAPGMFDGTMIADAPRLDAPVAVTLVKNSRGHVELTDRRVYLRAPTYGAIAQVALEVTLGDYESADLALAGRVPDAEWRSLLVQPKADRDAAIAWLAARHLAGSDVRLSKVSNSDLEIVAFSPSVYDWARFAIRRGDDNVGIHRGNALGVLDVDGMRYVLVDVGGARSLERV